MDIASQIFSNKPFVLPSRLPMILLEGCYLFPACHLPLFIFEERYRLMLDHALSTDRMFCVGISSKDGVESVTTAGLVRASVKSADGTSQVMLYGVSRVRITGWEQTEPFRIAIVEPVITQSVPEEELQAFKSRALNLLPHPTDDSCESMQLLRSELEQMEEAEAVCDIIAFHFVRRKAALSALLGECCPLRRYALIIAELDKAQD